jgi:GH15 family glucan-1,4-alpha-glucosidase
VWKSLWCHKTILIIAAALAVVRPALAAVQPHRSIQYLASSNGHCLISFNLETQRVDFFQPHIMDFWDSDHPVPNLVSSAGFLLELGDQRFNMSSLPVTQSGYENGSGIIRIDQEFSSLKIVTYIWAPMTMGFKVFHIVLQVSRNQKLNLKGKNFLLKLDGDPSQFQIIRTEQYSDNALWVGASVIYTAGLRSEMLKELVANLSKAKPKLLLEAEQRWWMHWHLTGKIPSQIINKDYQVLLQSAAFLKMAQCHESGQSFGQIVDNLSPTHQSIASPKDMSYAIIALCSLQHYDEAKEALLFMLSATAGQFRSYKYKTTEWGMGSNYQISLSQYAGQGYERTTTVQGYPLLYLDGQGTFLWALGEYAKRSSDFSLVKQYWNVIKNLVIEPLILSIDETGLIRCDSGWWNAPPPGLHFTFTSLSAYRGLVSASLLAHIMGQEELVTAYANKAAALRENILVKLTVGRSRVLTRGLEVTTFPYFLDGSAIEALNWGVIKTGWKSASFTIKALDTHLHVGDDSRGYSLAYTSKKDRGNENLFVTLRAIEAFNEVGMKKRAKQMLQWIIDQSSKNGEMIPEEFTKVKADYLGPYPSIGMGAGAFILAALSCYR